ncbi:MAG: hypothetical protein P8Y66_07165 [Nitrospirota bacterium]
MEEKPWYDDLVPEEEKKYKESVDRIKNAVLEKSMSFEQAAKLIEVRDENLRAALLDDALKVLLAELHFQKGKSLAEVSRMLKLSEKRLERARKEMLKDVEQAAIEKYMLERGTSGEA